MRAIASASVLSALALALPGASAHTVPRAAGTLLDTLTVDVGSASPTHGTFDLHEETKYTIEVSGTFTVSSNDGHTSTYDSLYCFLANGNGKNQCDPPFRGEEFFVSAGSDAYDEFDHFQVASAPHSKT